MSYKSDIDRADRTVSTESFPSVVLIDNCNACNLRCSMCDHVHMKQYRRVQLMDRGLYHKIIDEIAVEIVRIRIQSESPGGVILMPFLLLIFSRAASAESSTIIPSTPTHRSPSVSACLNASMARLSPRLPSARAAFPRT